MTRIRGWMMKLMGVPTCEEVAQFAYGYLEHQLEPEIARKFERHLRGCQDCLNFIESYRRVANPEGLVKDLPLDPEFELRVIEFLRRNR